MLLLHVQQDTQACLVVGRLLAHVGGQDRLDVLDRVGLDEGAERVAHVVDLGGWDGGARRVALQVLVQDDRGVVGTAVSWPHRKKIAWTEVGNTYFSCEAKRLR